ncbi:MAG: GNAT family N-acetyltransferase [Clostridium sp.]|nr:GNAT family N-acetyltransferase [Clostridium sp.]
MDNTKVFIEEIKNTDQKEFIIRDSAMITLGRIMVLEEKEGRKSALLRLRFYRDDAKILRGAIEKITQGFLREGKFFKVNLMVDEEVSSRPFTDLGYALEGILVNNHYQDGLLKNEYLFGTDALRFNQIKTSNFIELEGEKVSLKLASPAQAEDYLNYYRENREFLMEFEPLREPSFYTMEGQRKTLEEYYKGYLNGQAINFGIYLKGQLIGKVQLSNLIYGGFRSSNLGYALHKDFEGQGLMKDALREVISYAFEDLDLHRLEASTLLHNERSQKLLLHLGFEKIGLNPKFLFIHGKWEDHYSFCLIRP